MSNFLTLGSNHDGDPVKNDEVLFELAADLPEVLSEFVSLLERRNTKPAKEVSSYHFTKEPMFYVYPDVVRQYLDLFRAEPEEVRISIARNKYTRGALPQLTLGIICDNSAHIEVTCADGKDLHSQYTVTFLGNPDVPDYTCSPNEVSKMIASMVLSPDQLSDIDDMRRSGQAEEVNPRNPLLLTSYVSLLEDKADDFSSSQTYKLDALPSSESNGIAIPSIVLKTDQYANGASAYEISSRMRYVDSDIFQQAMVRAKIEVCSDGSLNSIEAEGKQSQKDFDRTTKQELEPSVIMPSIIALVTMASDEIKQARL